MVAVGGLSRHRSLSISSKLSFGIRRLAGGSGGLRMGLSPVPPYPLVSLQRGSQASSSQREGRYPQSALASLLLLTVTVDIFSDATLPPSELAAMAALPEGPLDPAVAGAAACAVGWR